ncbi:unnamed protein product [Heligmosomoides polygyrus]|uniref:Cation_ATPase_C domain-containing protein n=1 Tax=Heligmosomoides polygyrus TaxID=6339 RepID=A0A183FP58_HELPZ|nr:unnamed protein product [Heligmosomoides polygyrus]
MEDGTLFSSGMSTREAMERLVQVGRTGIERWSSHREATKCRCSVDKMLCRNLFVVSFVSAACLLIGAVTIENQLSYVLLGLAACHLIFLAIAHYLQWKLCRLSLEEKKRKAAEALDYVANNLPYLSTSSVNYAPLGEPLSDDMLTQSALRDGKVVAVPRLLLVEGDVILLRPTQAAPCDCRLMSGEILKVGERITSKVVVDHQTGASVPLTVTKAVATSTPLEEHLQAVGTSRRRFTSMDYQFYVALFPEHMTPDDIYVCGNRAVCDALKTPRVSSVKDFVTLLGNLTGTSFFDKKGLLSPVNPCLDKVVFFRPNTEEHTKESLTLETMDLSSEQLLDGSWSVDFDDPNWSRFDSNLRVIGQCLLLNHCDPQFTPFLDHLSAVASTVPRTIATACRRCSCAFPQLIGFKSSSADQFHQLPNITGFYQRRPGEAPLPGWMATSKLPGDTGRLIFCIALACSHVWDGEKVVPINERIIKAAMDFYQRHSVTGYCLALSYRSVGTTLDDSLKNRYFEVPLLHDFPRTGTLVRTHSLESSEDDPMFDRVPLKTADEVIQRWLNGHTLCGMIVAQHEVMPQAVQLIDQLETLCVRFVYFSRENELRSRVFAEKLGLEAGWNCHVSLAEVANDGDKRTLKDYFLSKGNIFFAMLIKSDEELHLKPSSRFPCSPSARKLSQPPVKVAVLPNKARLPTGIAAVRPHLEQVDNVPLLVGLITDCTPQANLQMLEIMQEYGELVLAIGSSLSVANTSVFLQADVSIAVMPVGDWQCSISPGPSWQLVKELTDRLMGVASDFRLSSFERVFLTVFVQLPCLTLGSIFTPFHPKSNVIRISSKLVRNATVTCSFVDVVCAVASENPSDAVLSTFDIRHVLGLHQVFYLCTLSSAWVFPLSSLWSDNPFLCLSWTVSCLGCVLLQVAFSYASGVRLHQVVSPLSLVVLVVWSTLIVVVNELIKMRSIRDFSREQRRTKLGFDTKLGMNSPY